MKQSTLDDLLAYRDLGQPPGDFLAAVLVNDLLDAFQRADEDNTRDMQQIIAWCYNNLPWAAWGSAEKLQAWIRARTADRLAANEQRP